jgi:hypothetical protein
MVEDGADRRVGRKHKKWPFDATKRVAGAVVGLGSTAPSKQSP